MTTGRQMFRLHPVLGVLMLLILLLGAAACGDGKTADTTTGPTTVGDGATSTTAPSTPQPLLVSAAAGLKNAFTEIAAVFDQTHNAETTLNLAASGQLRKQIEEGAPADVFASADPKHMQMVVDGGFVASDAVYTFASNTIVLIVPADSTLDIDDFSDLAATGITKIATGDPATTPLGAATHEILEKLDMEDTIAPKLIYTQTVNQTLNYVSQGEVDVGIVWASEAQAGGDKVRVVATVDRSLHSDVSFVIGTVKDSKQAELGQAFVDFVLGPEGQAILQKHGFLPAEQ